MIRINLLPVRAAQKKEKLRGQLIVLICALAVTLGLCGVVYISLLMKVESVKDEIAGTEQKIRSLKKALGEVAEFKKKKSEFAGKLETLEQLKQGKSGPVHLLDELSNVLPAKIWLTSFKESGGSITIVGMAINEDDIASFLKQLEGSPYYRDVELQVIEQNTQGGVKVNKFNVVAKAETPPKVAAK